MTITIEERNDALDRAKALILNSWTQRRMAQNQSGKSVSPLDLDACSFCAWGASIRVAKIPYREGLVDTLEYALTRVIKRFDEGNGDIAYFNDAPGRTKYEVAAIFDHAKEMPL